MKKKRGGIVAAIIIVAILAVLAVLYFTVGKKFFAGDAESGETAYVQQVAEIMGVGSGDGTVNRFAGVVESQETWSCKQNPEAEVKEIYVKVGDEVKVGTPLFVYDVEKYQTDLEQGEIDLERLNNELESMNTILDKLREEEKKAKAADKPNIEIQIEEQELTIKQKEIDIRTKTMDNEKLRENMAHATVESELDGIVKSIRSDNEDMYGQQDDSFITVMQVGNYRVKGSINEQNMYDISPGMPVIVHSRATDETWQGTIDRIDTENAEKNDSGYYYSDSGSQSSSSYPFYVELEDSTGLMLGQHVYLEPDHGQDEEPEDDGSVRLPEYYIDMTDEAHPFVYADENGKLVKRELTLGDYDEELMEYTVTAGLTREDKIAIPMGTELREGMPTADIADFVPEEGGMMDEGMMTDSDMMMDEGMMTDEGMMMDEGMMEEGVMEEEFMTDGMAEGEEGAVG